MYVMVLICSILITSRAYNKRGHATSIDGEIQHVAKIRSISPTFTKKFLLSIVSPTICLKKFCSQSYRLHIRITIYSNMMDFAVCVAAL